MFGNILIDKLRFSLRIKEGFNIYQARETLEGIMSKHFKKCNYTINYDKCYFRVTFTPTLYLDDFQVTDDKPHLNLEMISEDKLLFLLEEIYSVLGEGANVTWLDLTKNILTIYYTKKYIKALSKRKPRYPYKKTDFTSNVNISTLLLSPLKRKDVVDCRNQNR